MGHRSKGVNVISLSADVKQGLTSEEAPVEMTAARVDRDVVSLLGSGDTGTGRCHVDVPLGFNTSSVKRLET